MIQILINGVLRNPSNIGDLNITDKLDEESGAYQFERSLEGDLTYFKREDFQFFEALVSNCDSFSVAIVEDGNIIFEGVATKKDCTFNRSQCRVDVKVTNNDAVSCLKKNWDIEHNVLEEPNPTFALTYSAVPIGQPKDNTMQLEIVQRGDLSPQPAYGSRIGNINVGADQFWIYAAFVRTVNCINGNPVAPVPYGFVVGLPVGWQIVSAQCANGEYSVYFGQRMDVRSRADIISRIVITTSPVPANDYDLGTVVGDVTGTVYNVYIQQAVANTLFSNGRSLFNVIQFLLDKTGCGLSLSSAFFANPINPVTGIKSYTDQLLVFQKSDITDSAASEDATVLNLTLKDVLGDLAALFNVRWRIVGSTLQLEHISSLLPTTVGLNLTTFKGGKFIENQNSFTLDDGSSPRSEQLVLPTEGSDVDFARNQILYNDDCATDQPETIQAKIFDTEIVYRYDNPESGNQTAVLLDPNSLNSWQPNGDVVGAITGAYRPNVGLSPANLLNTFVNYYRPFDSGTFNGFPIALFDPKRRKKQVDITINGENLAFYDPSQLVITQLGSGQIQQISYNPTRKIAVLSILFLS